MGIVARDRDYEILPLKFQHHLYVCMFESNASTIGHSPSARQPRSSTRRQTVRRCTLYGRTLTLLA